MADQHPKPSVQPAWVKPQLTLEEQSTLAQEILDRAEEIMLRGIGRLTIHAAVTIKDLAKGMMVDDGG